MGRLAILCPGQGSQHPKMFDGLAASAHELDGGLRRAVESAIGRPLRDALADPAALFSNRVAQPLVVAASLQAWAALREHLPPVAMVAGYSVGELTAWSVAGALSAGTAIELAARRAFAMDAALVSNAAQGMLAVSGPAVAQTLAAARACGAYLAIANGPGACVIGGLDPDLERLSERLAASGARVTRLPVAVASHTPLMGVAAPRFAAALEACRIAAAAAPVCDGVSGALLRTPREACSALTAQLTQTIDWDRCMAVMVEAGASVVLELGPGAALARMFRDRFDQLPVRSVDEFHSVDGVVGWVRAGLQV